MPSTLELPTIEELRQAFHNAVRGQKDQFADNHAGAVYDHFAGIGAILWSWQAQRDKDQFEAIYFDRMTGQELTDYVLVKDGVERIEDTFGEGKISLSRDSVSGGAGTFWKGTRVRVFRNSQSVEYEISKDTICSASETIFEVPIKAILPGEESRIDASYTNSIITILDSLWDNTWRVIDIHCEAGTSFEKAAEFRTRVKIERKKNRVGYRDRIAEVCRDVGAYNVFLLESDFGGDSLDYGVNVAYVGDADYFTTDDLRLRTTVELEKVRVLGADLLILPMQRTLLKFQITLTLWNSLSNINVYEVKRTAISAIIDYFRSSSGFSYDLDKVSGEIRKIMPEIVKTVSFTLPSSSQSILQNGAFPATLTKYETTENSISVSLVGS